METYNLKMENPNQIHCKLTYLDQVRRFIFTGREFSELTNYVSTILGIPLESFVLKYLDNEGDRITMTSNDDLALAISFSDKLLRLVVDVPQTGLFPQQSQFPQQPQFPTFPTGAPSFQQSLPQSFSPQPFSPQSSQQFHQQQQAPPPSYSGYGYRHHHHHHGGRGGRGGQGGNVEFRKAKILSKLEFLKQNLAQLPPEEQSYRKQQLQMKIQHTEAKLARVDSWHEKKMMKQQQKMEKKWDKRLDPQTLNQIQILKGQVSTLKDTMSQIKEQKKAKKNELQICLQAGTGDKDAIWKELLTIKESGHEIGKQIAALKDQIRTLRGF